MISCQFEVKGIRLKSFEPSKRPLSHQNSYYHHNFGIYIIKVLEVLNLGMNYILHEKKEKKLYMTL